MNPWRFLDELNIQVFCISLMERPDRYEASKSEFKKVGLQNVQYYRPTADPRGGRIGCWLSHRALLRYCSGIVLIFEDDVAFSDQWHTQLYTIERFLRAPNVNWDLFYLGGLMHAIETPDAWTLKCQVTTTHAYFVHPDYARQLLDTSLFVPTRFQSLPMDHFYRRTARSYILRRPICYQSCNQRIDNPWGNAFIACLQHYMQYYVWKSVFVFNNRWTPYIPKWFNPFFWEIWLLDWLCYDRIP